MSGKDDVRAAINGAKAAKRPEQDGGRVKKRGYLKGYDLPERCPVTPLGLSGDLFYYMDACRQFRALTANKHGRLDLQSLFVPHSEYLEDHWPAYDKEGVVTGWKPEMVARALMDAAGQIGPVDVDAKVRGPGCWMADDGRLVMHCGDKIYCGDQAFLPGAFENHFYPSAAPRPHPADMESVGPEAAEELLSLLKSWNWRRPDVDPHLMLGWIGAAILGAALDWRPLVWTTGDKATGKSTLHKVVRFVLNPSGIISSADATEAGIRQKVGRMSLPVALDELEADEDNRRAMNVVKLARYACSGDEALRGSADHKGAAFVLRNCFLFSSILIPPIPPQDRSRMAILQLDTLGGEPPPALEPGHLGQLGRALRRRLMEVWPQFAERLHAYQAQLHTVGHDGRSNDVFSTLLACHDLLLFDRPPDTDTLADWAGHLRYEALDEAQDDGADWERCLAHLMTSPIDLYRSGEKRSVGSWVMQAAGRDPARHDIEEANRALGGVGLRVKEVRVGPIRPYYVLMVANAHQGLAALFRETRWTGKSGSSGVWVQSLRRVPDAQPGHVPARFDGVLTRYTEVLIDTILGPKNDGGAHDDFC